MIRMQSYVGYDDIKVYFALDIMIPRYGYDIE